MNSFKFFLISIIISFCAISEVSATTVTIDFESLQRNDVGYTFLNGVYTDSGYTFSVSNPDPFSFASAGILDSRFAGSTALTSFNYGFIFLQPVTGASFDLLTIDLAPVTLGLNDPFGIDRQVGRLYQTTIYGRKTDGSIVSQTIALPNTSASNILMTYSLQGFSGLTQVAIDGSAFPGVQFDNVVLQTVSTVPEPTLFCLMLLSLLTMFGIRQLH